MKKLIRISTKWEKVDEIEVPRHISDSVRLILKSRNRFNLEFEIPLDTAEVMIKLLQEEIKLNKLLSPAADVKVEFFDKVFDEMPDPLIKKKIRRKK